MNIEIRRLGPDGAQFLDQVAPDVFDAPIQPERLADYLADSSHLMAVACRAGVVVGQAAGVLHRHLDQPTELYIDEVGVTPSLRGRGIARRLMVELAEWGRELGCQDAWLGAETDNELAKALYARFASPEPILMYYWEL